MFGMNFIIKKMGTKFCPCPFARPIMVLNKVRKIKSPLPMSDSIRLLFGAQFRTVAKSKNDLRQAQRLFF
jgi:hypothetical protein